MGTEGILARDLAQVINNFRIVLTTKSLDPLSNLIEFE